MAGAAGSLSPDVSAAWAWSECGRISASAALPQQRFGGKISSLGMSEDGQLLVSNDGLAIAWRVAEPFGASEVLWAKAGEGAYNTDVSRDGRLVATSGDVRLVFDARDGTSLALPAMEAPLNIDFSNICIGSEFRFSPDGRYIAGKRYGTQIDVFDLTTLKQVAQMETNGCGQGLTFSAELITSPEGSFRTSDWSATTSLNATPSTGGLSADCEIYLEPSSGAPTTCCNGHCQTHAADVTIDGGKHASLSREGHWLVAGGTLAHLPSGETRVLDDAASEALFAPNGDVIVGEQTGDLVRFCRSD